MSKRKKPQEVSSKVINQNPPKYIKYILSAFAFLLYSNTFNHDFTQDDAIVIYDNMYTQQGFAGIPGLLTKDTFHGFFKVDGKDKLVKGGRYRPLTPIMFAIEYQFFGKSPKVGHFLNVLFYALLVLVLFHVLTLLFYEEDKPKRSWIIVGAVAIFAFHPIHTEVVANIKGRDEIMTLMGSLGAFYFLLRKRHGPDLLDNILAFVCFFLALMSKENAITFLAVIPLSIYLFRGRDIRKAALPLLSLGVATVVFLGIRTKVLGMDFGGQSYELMNNPFLKIVDGKYVDFSFVEWASTIMFTLGKYVSLLFNPHPLTHDYYPRHIDIMNLGDWKVWLSMLVYIAMIIGMFLTWKKKPILSWSIAFYLITLSIVSNIVFPIGTNMSERFVFMPSIGFAVFVSYFLFEYFFAKNRKVLMGIFAILLLAYSIKTFTRNSVWKNDYTLFTTDVKTSGQSAKILNAAGGALSSEAGKMSEGAQKTQMLDESIVYLNRAIGIHPNYKNASLLLGNAYFYKKEYDKSIQSYSRSLQIDPNFSDALKNLAIAYRDGGRYAGERQNDLQKARRYLLESYKLNPDDIETVRLLGVTEGVAGNHTEAIKYFSQVLTKFPDSVSAMKNLGNAYLQNGEEDQAKAFLSQAAALERQGKQ